MRILYVTKESPLFPAGGIGTYLGYMAQAMADAGHEVYLFTWAEHAHRMLTSAYAPFKPQHVHIEWIDPSDVWRRTPVASFNHSLATYLRARIRHCVESWDIDVIEATDFLAPALTYFQDAQTRRAERARLCVTYNHGFIEDFHEADQIDISRSGLDDLLAERQQCRISDLVVAPSRIASERLRSYGITGKVEIVREPYVFQSKAKFRKFRNEITYIGRISISKGIGKIIYYANAVHDVLPLQQIRLIGRVIDTPFRVKDAKTYVMTRLHPALRDATQFYGFMPRENALALLEPGALCPSLGSAETFSYACVESIDYGLLPVVRHGTPMAEFIPPALQEEIVLDEQMRQVEELQAKTEKIVARGPALLREVQSYCAEQLHPKRIARQMDELYARKLDEKRGVTSVRVKPRAGIADVTVLIPAYRPTAEFAETVDALLLQNAGVPKVLICNDGTPEEHGAWFEYARSLLPDCTVLRQPNAGLMGARNTLVRHCATGLSVFLDTDDVLAGHCLERMLEAYNSSPLKSQAVLPQRVNFSESGELIIRTLLDDHVHLLENDFRMTGLIETAVLREIGFDATCRNGEADDWIFWLEFTARGYTGVLLPELVFHYRFRQGSMSWPWSMGQHVGSQLKLRQVMNEACRRHPDFAGKIARAFYTHTVRQAN